MQTGQEKVGMQTMNQCLATLYQRKQVTLEHALEKSSNRDELQDLINARRRRGGGRRPAPPAARSERRRGSAE